MGTERWRLSSPVWERNGGGYRGTERWRLSPNLLVVSNTGNDTPYTQAVKEEGRTVHPARYPDGVPRPFIEMLTDPGDLVVDPFAGSNVTGRAAEILGRRWLSVDSDAEYVEGSRNRFEAVQMEISVEAS